MKSSMRLTAKTFLGGYNMQRVILYAFFKKGRKKILKPAKI